MRNRSAILFDNARRAGPGYIALNPPECIERLHLQMALLNMAAADPRSLPEAEALAAVEGTRC